ncbi:MAG: glutamate 5-kinase [Candidatus Absconditabacteria bacterium]
MNNRIIVVKIGTASLFDCNSNIDYSVISSLANQIYKLYQTGIKVVLVSSGAVGLGKFKTKENPVINNDKIVSKQVYASIGQPILMKEYQKEFDKYSMVVSQALFTRSDFADRGKYLNMRQVLTSMLNNNIIPIINENDVLSPEELDFSDNDQLAAYVAGMLSAEKLVILTVVDGLYDKNPCDKDAKKFELIEKIDDEILSYAQNIKSSMGTGGMLSKLYTARLIMNLGISMVIALAKEDDVLLKILNNENIGTLFRPSYNPKITGVRRWLTTGAFPKGKIVVSNTITDLINNGKRASILLAGVESFTGDFEKGDVVEIRDVLGKQLGYGLVRQSTAQLASSFNSKERDIIVVHTDYFMVN